MLNMCSLQESVTSLSGSVQSRPTNQQHSCLLFSVNVDLTYLHIFRQQFHLYSAHNKTQGHFNSDFSLQTKRKGKQITSAVSNSVSFSTFNVKSRERCELRELP